MSVLKITLSGTGPEDISLAFVFIKIGTKLVL